MRQHARERAKAVLGSAVLGVARDQSSPGHNVSAGHFVEQLVGVVQMPTFRVHVDEVVSEEHVGGAGGIFCEEAEVEGSALSEEASDGTGAEEGGVGLVGLR